MDFGRFRRKKRQGGDGAGSATATANAVTMSDSSGASSASISSDKATKSNNDSPAVESGPTTTTTTTTTTLPPQPQQQARTSRFHGRGVPFGRWTTGFKSAAAGGKRQRASPPAALKQPAAPMAQDGLASPTVAGVPPLSSGSGSNSDGASGLGTMATQPRPMPIKAAERGRDRGGRGAASPIIHHHQNGSYSNSFGNGSLDATGLSPVTRDASFLRIDTSVNHTHNHQHHNGYKDRRNSLRSPTSAAAPPPTRPPPPRIPPFLAQSPHEIEAKFQELVWQERNRLLQSAMNPARDFRWARVQGPHLRQLDRYVNIQPWHNHRIRLCVPRGNVDYINASPIELPPSSAAVASLSAHSAASADSATSSSSSSAASTSTLPVDRFIAMQGPKKTSADHVWRMVAEQTTGPGPGVIVMLTETHEGNTEKCYPYFPREGDPPLRVNEADEFGDGWRATVEFAGREPTSAGDAIELRKLLLRVRRREHSGATPPPPDEEDAPSSDEDSDMDSSESDEAPANPRRPTTRKTARRQQSLASTATVTSTTDDRRRSRILNVGHGSFGSLVNGGNGLNVASAAGASSNGRYSSSTLGRDDAAAGGWWGTPTPQGFVDEEKIVWHFLYKKWPDFGVPQLEDLSSFFALMRLSRERSLSVAPQQQQQQPGEAAGGDAESTTTAPSTRSGSGSGSSAATAVSTGNPRIVHCSAGVGRSGTFIALEHLMRELDEGAFATDRYYPSSMGGGVANTNANGGSRANNRNSAGSATTTSSDGSGSTTAHANASGYWRDEYANNNNNNNNNNNTSDSTAAAEASDPVFETVNRLREQRRTMVQAEGQFVFIYQVLRKLWQDKYGVAEADDGAAEPAAKRIEVAGTGVSASAAATGFGAYHHHHHQPPQQHQHNNHHHHHHHYANGNWSQGGYHQYQYQGQGMRSPNPIR